MLATPPVTVEVCSPDDFALVVDEFLWRAEMIAQIVVALAIRQLCQRSTVIRVRNIGNERVTSCARAGMYFLQHPIVVPYEQRHARCLPGRRVNFGDSASQGVVTIFSVVAIDVVDTNQLMSSIIAIARDIRW
ncbi:hypothetical protein WJ12_00070 [Burkholderia seminalis]|nr:hypothetical protein WJ12_00070 [Burkholderia seminalis]KVF43311.1 hypothetical protein WJ13_00930 [Burkholderia seminalis]